jgi:hypothetical protein
MNNYYLKNATHEIHVWFDDQINSKGDHYGWTVSRMNCYEDEINCESNHENDLQGAWEFGCDLADQYGVDCIQTDRYTHREEDRYSPTSADKEEE